MVAEPTIIWKFKVFSIRIVIFIHMFILDLSNFLYYPRNPKVDYSQQLEDEEEEEEEKHQDGDTVSGN